MPELRKDPVISRWVIISTERSKRPSDFRKEKEEQKEVFCPFCPGNEGQTPPEIFAIRPHNSAPNSQGWELRVIPNKFPALGVDGQLNRRGEGIYDMMSGVGAHEVIIETPKHGESLADLSLPHIQQVFSAFKNRILDLRNDIRLKYTLIFKNHGAAAGASLAHSHSQLIATPILPKRIVEELSGARNYFKFKERCIFCDIIHQELKDGVRVVFDNDLFIALAPYAPRFPFETWILPKEHHSHFELINEEGLQHLALTLKILLQKINAALQFPAYNFVIHTSPVQEAPLSHYHWHIEFMPRLIRTAGFEWGTGFYINTTSPESAAKYLREIEI